LGIIGQIRTKEKHRFFNVLNKNLISYKLQYNFLREMGVAFDLDLLFISHQLLFHILGEGGARLKTSSLGTITLLYDEPPSPTMLSGSGIV
jgi:hypothetical protein